MHRTVYNSNAIRIVLFANGLSRLAFEFGSVDVRVNQDFDIRVSVVPVHFFAVDADDDVVDVLVEFCHCYSAGRSLLPFRAPGKNGASQSGQ